MKRSDPGSSPAKRSPRRSDRLIRMIAATGIAAATISCGKLALAALPNVEIVTLLTALYGYTFGLWGVLAAAVFVAVEPLLWGVGTWLITYALYWPFVALVFAGLSRLRVRNRFVLTGAALLLVLWFGVLSSLSDVGLFMGRFDNFFARFGIVYARGLVFYALELATNAILFPLCFPFLSDFLLKIRARFLQ